MNQVEIIEAMRMTGKISRSYLQRKLKISYNEAKLICDSLVLDKKENIYLKRMNEYLDKLK